jgi:hypothetical protein
LTDREREMLGHCYALGESIKEIAVVFGQSPGAVATSLYRIRNEWLLCIQDNLGVDKEMVTAPRKESGDLVRTALGPTSYNVTSKRCGPLTSSRKPYGRYAAQSRITSCSP